MIDTSIIEQYKNGSSLTLLSKKYHITAYALKKELGKLGIHIRSRNEQNKYSPQNQRIYNINDDYFSTQNHNMVYLLGFLAANGCVYQKNNSIKIGLSSVDKAFLEQINTELNSTFPIKDYETKDGFKVSELKITSSQIKKDLAEYNIVPNKTYNFIFPEKIKSEYYIDFIRGYFDGDGSVSTAGKALRFQICSYQKSVLERIIDIFQDYNIQPVNIYKQRNLYYFQYSTNATKQIYNILYTDNCFSLPRKKQKYETLLMK